MIQPWHDILFLSLGFLIGLPCGCIAVLAGAREKKSRAGLAPKQRQAKLYNHIIRDDFPAVKREADHVS